MARHLLQGLKVDERVVCLASDLGKDRLGLTERVYKEIARSVTLILHVSLAPSYLLHELSTDRSCSGPQNAWSVNFVSVISVELEPI